MCDVTLIKLTSDVFIDNSLFELCFGDKGGKELIDKVSIFLEDGKDEVRDKVGKDVVRDEPGKLGTDEPGKLGKDEPGKLGKDEVRDEPGKLGKDEIGGRLDKLGKDEIGGRLDKLGKGEIVGKLPLTSCFFNVGNDPNFGKLDIFINLLFIF